MTIFVLVNFFYGNNIAVGGRHNELFVNQRLAVGDAEEQKHEERQVEADRRHNYTGLGRVAEKPAQGGRHNPAKEVDDYESDS